MKGKEGSGKQVFPTPSRPEKMQVSIDKWKRSWGLILLGWFILAFPRVYASYPEGQGKKVCTRDGLFIESVGDLLTVDIKEGALQDVLGEISRQRDITFLIADNLGGERVMVRFSRLRVDEGLARILKDYNCIYLYIQERLKGEEPSPLRLREVRVYPREVKGKISLMTIAGGRQHFPSASFKPLENGERQEARKDTPVDSIRSVLERGNEVEKIEVVKDLASRKAEEALLPLAMAVKDRNKKVQEEAKKALLGLEKSLAEEDKVLRQELGEEEEEPPPPEERKGSGDLSINGSGNSFSVDLRNDVPVGGLLFTIEGALPAEVRTTSRSEGFVASFDKAHRRVILFSANKSTIAPGNGPVLELVTSSAGDSVKLTDKKISDAYGYPIKIK